MLVITTMIKPVLGNTQSPCNLWLYYHYSISCRNHNRLQTSLEFFESALVMLCLTLEREYTI